jgi:choline dehydrogenase
VSAGLPSNEWDYVIVGGGTAGCVLAARLTEDPGTSVLVLEAGGEYPGLVLSAPLPGMRHMVRYSWKYFTRQQPELGHRRISFPFGKVLGGSSSINAMMYFRGTAAAYDRWCEYGNPEWGFSDVLPYFRKAEHQQRGGSDVHGASGPIHVSDPRHRAPFSQAFVEACLETGMRHVEDFNGPAPEGAGFFQVTQRRGRRAGAATGYLAPARRRKDLRVETYAEVEKVVLEGDRAVGVDYRVRSGEPQRARVRRELLICAGALNSPKILMLSGIGPADELKAVGVSPKHDLPGVGRNLQDHVRIPVLYESGRRSPGDMVYWAPAALRYAVLGRGVLASNCCEAGALLRTSFATEIPDLQFVTHFQSSLYPGTVDLQFCLLRTMSRGRVTLASCDPQAPPVIDPAYLSESADRAAAVEGVQKARQLAATAALRRFPLGKEVLPGFELESDDELESYCRSAAETCYHSAGTCRMGTGPDAVVDSQLRVRGLRRLRVVDASIMPELPNGNTCAPVVMIAERAADLIRGG